MFQLFHNKDKFIITISPMTVYGENYVVSNEVRKFNENYYVSDNRQILQEYAKELQQEWIKEYKTKLTLAQNMKIKNKYK